jgi:hypothetical protein
VTECPEFKPQYQQKKKKKENPNPKNPISHLVIPHSFIHFLPFSAKFLKRIVYTGYLQLILSILSETLSNQGAVIVI